MEQTDENEKVDDFCEAVDALNKKNKEDFERKREEAIRRNDNAIQISYRKSERKKP